MQKTLVTQGKISNRRDSVRSESRPSRSAVLQEIVFPKNFFRDCFQKALESSRFPGLFCVGGLARPGRRGRQSFRKGAVSCPLSHLPSNSSESRENPSLRPSEAAWLRSGQDGGLVCQKDNKFASGEPPRRLQFSVPCDTISSTYRRAVCFPRSRSSLSAF